MNQKQISVLAGLASAAFAHAQTLVIDWSDFDGTPLNGSMTTSVAGGTATYENTATPPGAAISYGAVLIGASNDGGSTDFMEYHVAFDDFCAVDLLFNFGHLHEHANRISVSALDDTGASAFVDLSLTAGNAADAVVTDGVLATLATSDNLTDAKLADGLFADAFIAGSVSAFTIRLEADPSHSVGEYRSDKWEVNRVLADATIPKIPEPSSALAASLLGCLLLIRRWRA